jgi:adenosylhomocysteine nucleosidase
MNRENRMLCLVFPLGMEAGPFLRRVEIVRRWTKGKATYREVFFEGTRLLAVRCGIGPHKAGAAIRNLGVAPSAVISVGTAGALDPDLQVGDLFIAAETVFEDDPATVLPCSSDLSGALRTACVKEGVQFKTGRLITVSAAVFPTEDRIRLHRQTGAAAVDMESHAMGLQARAMGVPFACLRVVSDDVQASRLPRKPDLKQLKREPRHLPSALSALVHLWRFMRNFRQSVNQLHPVLVRFIRESPTGFSA